jgi:hypothetical protein
MVTNDMDFFNGVPLDHVIASKKPNEAYCRGIEGQEYLVYFTNGGQVQMNLALSGGEGSIKWMSLDSGNWEEEGLITGGELVNISAPGTGNWLALIK